MHDEAMQWVAATTAGRRFNSIVELGARDVNGSVKGLFSSDVYIAVDIGDGPGVDVVCDAADYRPDTPVELVVTTEMMEHAPRAPEIPAAVFAMLQPDGLFIGTAAGPGRAPHSAIDGKGLQAGEHYANIHPTDLTEWLMTAGFVDIEIDVQRRPADIRWIARRPSAIDRLSSHVGE